MPVLYRFARGTTAYGSVIRILSEWPVLHSFRPCLSPLPLSTFFRSALSEQHSVAGTEN